MWFIVSGLCSPTEQEMQQYYASWGSKARQPRFLYHPHNVFVPVFGQQCWFFCRVWLILDPAGRWLLFYSKNVLRNGDQWMHILHNKSTFPFSFYVTCSLSMFSLPHLFFFLHLFSSGTGCTMPVRYSVASVQWNEQNNEWRDELEPKWTHPCTWTWLNLDILHSKPLG